MECIGHSYQSVIWLLDKLSVPVRQRKLYSSAFEHNLYNKATRLTCFTWFISVMSGFIPVYLPLIL